MEAVKVKAVAWLRTYWVVLLFPVGFGIGKLGNRWQDSMLTDFRNKSKLYSRELRPGEEYTWK